MIELIPPYVYVGLDYKVEDKDYISYVEDKTKTIINRFCGLDYQTYMIDNANSRKREYVVPRQIYFFLCHNILLGRREYIISKFAREKGFNHGTLISNINRIKGFVETDKLLNFEIQNMLKSIKEWTFRYEPTNTFQDLF